jgi:hypothetical protein
MPQQRTAENVHAFSGSGLLLKKELADLRESLVIPKGKSHKNEALYKLLTELPESTESTKCYYAFG